MAKEIINKKPINNNTMKLFTLEISENSKFVYKTTQTSVLNCIDDSLNFIKSNGIHPTEKSGFFVSIKEKYVTNIDQIVTKYKQDKFAFFKYFSIHYYDFDILETKLMTEFFYPYVKKLKNATI